MDKLCECGCGLVVKPGNKRINGHGSKGIKRSEKIKSNMRKSWTVDRKKELQGKEQVMKNKYEKIFTQEEEDDAEINYPYELKKANIVISNLIEQRNIALDKLAMIRAEAIMLNDELMELKEKYKETETEEEKEEEIEPNAEEQTIYCIELYQSRLTDATRMS